MKDLSALMIFVCLILVTACSTPPGGSGDQKIAPTTVTATPPPSTIEPTVPATVGFTAVGPTTAMLNMAVHHEIMPTRNHHPEGTPIQYNTIPPTSGDHWPQWSNCGFFEEELPDERIVHNLEHSNIVVSYNLTSPEEIDQLRDVMNNIQLARTTGVTRFYSKIPPGTVALTAWGVSDTMPGVDVGRIEKFFKAYAGTAGPEGNITCFNTGVMP